MDILVAVLGRAHDDLDLIGVDQKAAGHRASALAVVLGCGKDSKYSIEEKRLETDEINEI